MDKPEFVPFKVALYDLSPFRWDIRYTRPEDMVEHGVGNCVAAARFVLARVAPRDRTLMIEQDDKYGLHFAAVKTDPTNHILYTADLEKGVLFESIDNDLAETISTRETPLVLANSNGGKYQASDTANESDSLFIPFDDPELAIREIFTNFDADNPWGSTVQASVEWAQKIDALKDADELQLV